MKTVVSIILISIFMVFSLCRADDSLQKAYSLYNQGRMQEAIKILEDYVDGHPDPRALYFIGYAYYKIGKTEKARRYFEEAYLIDPDFSPVKR